MTTKKIQMANTSAVTRVSDNLGSKSKTSAQAQASSRSRSTASKLVHGNDIDIEGGASISRASDSWMNERRGVKYVGVFVMRNGKPEGEGTITYGKGRGGVYTGHFKDGKPHGFGKMDWERGDSYEGMWQNGKKHGTGKCTYVHGHVYQGEWMEGKKHGQGKMDWEGGNSYEGEWVHGKQHGVGKETRKHHVYEGEWVHGKKQGVGEMKYWSRADGDVVKGIWKNGNLRAGKVIYANGDEYVGDLRSGFPDGHGKMTKANGTEFEGDWCLGEVWTSF
eukprot:scaffold11714_cov123-Skeletonema_marinoi.AAC.4